MRATILLIAVTGLTTVAHADPRGDADIHARRGVALYNLGQYAEAIAEFEDAYKAFQSDALLFNLAQAHRKLEHCDRAVGYYHQYLSGSPTPALARQVEKLLPELEAACRTRDARPDGPVPAAASAGSPAAEPTAELHAATAAFAPASGAASAEHVDSDVDAEAAPAVPDATLHLGASAFVGEVLSGGNAPITGIRATATWHAFDGVELGAALGVGEMFRYDAMDNTTVAQLAAAIEHRTVFAWGRLTAGGELGVEYVSLLGSSRDVVPGVGRTNQWAPLVRGEVGVEHDISPLFALRGAIAASVCPPVGMLEAAVGELDLVVGLRYAP
ncbi:MAG: tetratricopeptide repeat protein [Kofleriaceae bacterium]